jgi:general secretion pathway protein M
MNIDILKDWFINLSSREQRLVAIGGTLVIFAIIYFLLWQPVADRLQNLQQDVVAQRELYQWMQQNVPELKARRLSGYAAQTTSPGSILSVIDDSLKDNNLNKPLKEINKTNENTVSLQFDNVSFDELIAWLINFSHQQRVTISQFTATPTQQTGMVKAELAIQFIQ